MTPGKFETGRVEQPPVFDGFRLIENGSSENHQGVNVLMLLGYEIALGQRPTHGMPRSLVAHAYYDVYEVQRLSLSYTSNQGVKLPQSPTGYKEKTASPYAEALDGAEYESFTRDGLVALISADQFMRIEIPLRAILPTQQIGGRTYIDWIRDTLSDARMYKETDDECDMEKMLSLTSGIMSFMRSELDVA